MKALHMVTWILIVVGALNWGLVGAFNLNVVMYLGATLAKIVYILVGLSALFELFNHKNTCKMCNPGGGMMNMNKPAGM